MFSKLSASLLVVLVLAILSLSYVNADLNDCSIIQFEGLFATTCPGGSDGFPDCAATTPDPNSGNHPFATLSSSQINSNTFFSSYPNINPATTNVNFITLSAALNGQSLFIDVFLATDNGNFPSNFSVAYLSNNAIPTVVPAVNSAGYNFINDPSTGTARVFQFAPAGDAVELTQINQNGNGAFNSYTLIFINVTENSPGSSSNPGGQGQSCNAYFYFNFTNPQNSSLRGDPQFAGLRGQSFQVHGIDGAIYNLISDKAFNLNSRFSFLTGPRPCPIMPSTGKKSSACFSHAGSYLGEIGLVLADGTRLFIESGPAASGFSAVELNGQEVAVGTSSALLSYTSTHELTVRVGQWTIQVENSDHFVNLRQVSVSGALSTLQSHGLLGQTWQNKRYSGKVKEIEGDVDDYMISEDDVFGKGFVYNQFLAHQ